MENLSDPQETSSSWSTELLHALEIGDVPVDLPKLRAASQVLSSQTAETDQLMLGFIAGYAAGLAEGSGQADFSQAHQASLDFTYSFLNSRRGA